MTFTLFAKSSVGHALENHLEQVFRQHGISCSRGKMTENKVKPDFIFPDISDYHNSAFPAVRLTMLGVKSTCKDRWRQVLSEAARIERKHLFTLEPGISENQTAEMAGHKLTRCCQRACMPATSPCSKAIWCNWLSLSNCLKGASWQRFNVAGMTIISALS